MEYFKIKDNKLSARLDHFDVHVKDVEGRMYIVLEEKEPIDGNSLLEALKRKPKTVIELDKQRPKTVDNNS